MRQLGDVRTGRYMAFCRAIPNALTLLALANGMAAIHLAMARQWEMAVVAILIAAVFDGLDGRAARLLRCASPFGAELDSLSDVVCFGVAPAVVVYFWAAWQVPVLGGIAALAYVACCGIRLARFNVESATAGPARSHSFFTGVPAPAAAMLALEPMLAAFATESEFFRSSTLNVALLLTVAALMVSRLPTPSLKRVNLSFDRWRPLHVGLAAGATLLVVAPWTTLAAAGLVYVAALPVSTLSFRRQGAARPRADGEIGGAGGS